MTPREFERKCINDFKKRIRLPEKNYQVINRDNRRFCYLFDNEIKYIIFPTPEHFASFLLENGIVKKVLFGEKSLRIYKERFEMDFIRKSFLQRSIVEEVKWNEIVFSEEEIIELAARKEFESIGGIIGHCTAKVIPFTTFTFLAA
jgi:hypothetical protein